MLAETLGDAGAKWFMDNHEANNPNPPDETNMDKWNNNVGREEYQRWREATDLGKTTDPLDKWIYDRVKEGGNN